MTPKKSSSLPAPVADTEQSYDVTVRVRMRGKPEKCEPALRDVFERQLPFMFPDAEIRRVRRAAR